MIVRIGSGKAFCIAADGAFTQPQLNYTNPDTAEDKARNNFRTDPASRTVS